jgi:phosphoglucomutase
LAAKAAAENGCDAFVFDNPRSVPELSFAVRSLRANAGIVITASHNPPYDNGYKAYFSDGAQVIDPHASGIIAKVNAITTESFAPLPKEHQGKVTVIGKNIDQAYMHRLETLILDSRMVREAKSLRIVYTPLHGTGSVIIRPMLNRLGFNFKVVPEQDCFDGRFPTVKSPNPEYGEALTMAINLAEKENADLVAATDPDCDRMGVAVRSREGKMKLLTGNQIGSLLAWYRIKTLFDKGVLNKTNAARSVIIKTFVTTDLQNAIAGHYGVRCVETLTGFKYIGAKLAKYEGAIPELADAHIVTTFGGNWAEGARMQRVYVAPGAEDGPHYERVIRVAERNMIKMRTADSFFRRIHPDGHELRITASVGVAMSDGSLDDEPDIFLRRADEAMYDAKHAGRDSWSVAPVG